MTWKKFRIVQGQDLKCLTGTRIVPGKICDVEQVSGSLLGMINHVERICYVDRAQGLLQGSDLLRRWNVTGAYLVAKLHET